MFAVGTARTILITILLKLNKLNTQHIHHLMLQQATQPQRVMP